jgi:hypothetical protein
MYIIIDESGMITLLQAEVIPKDVIKAYNAGVVDIIDTIDNTMLSENGWIEIQEHKPYGET